MAAGGAGCVRERGVILKKKKQKGRGGGSAAINRDGGDLPKKFSYVDFGIQK
jgi:hypothetical protein